MQSKLYDFDSDPAAFFTALDRGDICAVTEGTFDYFLGVLPPRSMGATFEIVGIGQVRTSFEFQEGSGDRLLFWIAAGKMLAWKFDVSRAKLMRKHGVQDDICLCGATLSNGLCTVPGCVCRGVSE